MGKATYENLTLDEERALYGLHHAEVRNCTFAGPADGESALKECSELLVSDCDFELRYPFLACPQYRASQLPHDGYLPGSALV